VVLAIALLVVGGVALWGALTSEPASPGPASSKADPPAAKPPTSRVPQSASKSPAAEEALVVRCRAAKCGVFITVPNNGNSNVLFNGFLAQGEVRRADEPRMYLVVSDASAVDVYINGKLQGKGTAGKRTYTIIKSSSAS
jgi:hypothetical protein